VKVRTQMQCEYHLFSRIEWSYNNYTKNRKIIRSIRTWACVRLAWIPSYSCI